MKQQTQKNKFTSAAAIVPQAKLIATQISVITSKIATTAQSTTYFFIFFQNIKNSNVNCVQKITYN